MWLIILVLVTKLMLVLDTRSNTVLNIIRIKNGLCISTNRFYLFIEYIFSYAIKLPTA
jgi:hypothetical protein